MTDWTARAEDAVTFLAETDKDVAELRAGYEREKRKAKQEYAKAFLRADGSVEARKATAEVCSHFQSAQAAELKYLKEWQVLTSQRDSACTLIDFWRSYMKAVSEGHV